MTRVLHPVTSARTAIIAWPLQPSRSPALPEAIAPRERSSSLSFRVLTGHSQMRQDSPRPRNVPYVRLEG